MLVADPVLIFTSGRGVVLVAPVPAPIEVTRTAGELGRFTALAPPIMLVTLAPAVEPAPCAADDFGNVFLIVFNL